MEFTGLTSASHMSLPEAGYGSEEGYVGSEISGAVSGVTTPGASRLQASQSQQRSTTMQRLHRLKTFLIQSGVSEEAAQKAVEDAKKKWKEQKQKVPKAGSRRKDASGHFAASVAACAP